MRSAGLLVLALVAGTAAGQPRRGAVEQRPPPVAWPHAPTEAGTLVTRAERVEREGPHVILEGYAQLGFGSLRVQADRIEMWEDDMRIEATGNVVFERGNEKVVADSLSASLSGTRARFENARGILGQDFYFVAESVEENEEGHYVIERGAFTTCAQPVPRWNFTASRAVVRPERSVWLRNVAFRVKGVPLAWVPAMYYPIEEDGRQTGLLMPRYARSDSRGHLISQGFFWAINRSMDLTASLDHFTVAGTGLGVEYRYQGGAGSSADAEGFLINDKTTGEREYSLNYNVRRRLPGRFRLSALGEQFSSFDFGNRFQNSFSRSTRRYKRIKADLGGTVFRHNLQVKVDRKETQYPTRSTIRQTMPQFRIKRRSLDVIGRYVQLGYELDYVRVGKSRSDDFEEWDRVFVGPTLQLALPEIPFLDLSGEVEAGYARYSGSRDPDTRDFVAGRTLSRRYQGVGFQMGGPKFERIFETPDNFYAARLKHLIEPEARWSLRTSDDNFDEVNRFDRYDRFPTTNEIQVGIANRLLAKRYRDGVEESSATDLATWRVHQSFFFDPAAGSYAGGYSSSSLEEGEVRKSPIRSDFRFTPDPILNGDWTMEWDPEESLFTSIRAGVRFGDRLSNRSFDASWSRRARRLGSEPDDEADVTSYLRTGADFYPTEALRTSVRVNYDVSERRMSNLRTRLDFLFQCCGVSAEWIRYNLVSRQENLFQFGITLGGITSFAFGSGEGRDRYY